MYDRYKMVTTSGIKSYHIVKQQNKSEGKEVSGIH